MVLLFMVPFLTINNICLLVVARLFVRFTQIEPISKTDLCFESLNQFNDWVC